MAKGAQAGAKALKRTKSGKRFFSVEEDYEIHQSLTKETGKSAVSLTAKNLAKKLGRSSESIRDRIRHFLKGLSTKDAAKLAAANKSSPKHFVLFKVAKDGAREIERISADYPLHAVVPAEPKTKKIGKKKGQGISVKGRKAATGEKPKTPEQRLSWVKDRLKNKDVFFRVEFGIEILVAVLNALIEHEGVSKEQVNDYLKKTVANQSLQDVLSHFKLAKLE